LHKNGADPQRRTSGQRLSGKVMEAKQGQ